MTETTANPPSNQSPHHETTDAKMNPVLWFFVVLVVFTAIIQLVIFWMMILFNADTEANTPPQPPIAKERPQLRKDLSVIPEPRLQVEEAKDLKTLQDRDDKLLTSYGVSKGTNNRETIRIPIQRAMELMAKQKGNAK